MSNREHFRPRVRSPPETRSTSTPVEVLADRGARLGGLNLDRLLDAMVAITFDRVHKLAENKKIRTVIIGCISAEILGVEYGWYSLICTLMMINLKGSSGKRWWITWLIVNILYRISAKSYIQIFGILTPAILSLHDTTKDKKQTASEKKLFYYFYPIDLAGLATLRAIL